MVFGNYQVAKNTPGGTDFIVHWASTRDFFSTGTSPYSDDTALKIQTLVYGRAAQGGENDFHEALPLYSIIFFAPFSLISNFTLARACWLTLLELCLLAIAILSLRLTYWKPKLWLFGILLLFVLVSFPAFSLLINGNAIILVTLLLILSLLLIRDGKDEAAGILLAISTLKPQSVFLLLIFIFFWAIINRRYRIIGYFLGALIVLVGFSALLIPNWLVQYTLEVLRFPFYNLPLTISSVINDLGGSVGSRMSIVLSAILLLLLGVEWWKGRNSRNKYFLWISLLTISVSQWIGIKSDPGNFILLYPTILFCLEMISGRWKKKANLVIITLLSIITLGIWILFLLVSKNNYQPIQSPLLSVPLAIIVFVLLYWVRWWVISSKKVDYSNQILEI
jgi:hypothetical protein